jgi:hypothetical protein
MDAKIAKTGNISTQKNLSMKKILKEWSLKASPKGVFT